MATIDITAKLSGKGKATDLGLSAGFGGRGMRGGRGGQGGGQGGDEGTDDAEAGFDIQGTILFDVKSQQVIGANLKGEVKVARATKRTFPGRDGEEQKMESTVDTTGKFELEANCEAAK